MQKSTEKADGGIGRILYKGESAQFPRSEIEKFFVNGYAEQELFLTQMTYFLSRRSVGEDLNNAERICHIAFM